MKGNESSKPTLRVASRGTVVEGGQDGRRPSAGHESVARGGRSRVLLNQDGEVPMAWRLVLLVVSFLAAAYLLRYVPIRLQASILSSRGLSPSEAVVQARHTILDDPVWSSLVGIAQGLLWYPLVCFLIAATEGRPCSLRDLGLATGRIGFLLVPLGVALAGMMHVGYVWVGRVLSGSSIARSPGPLRAVAVALAALNFIVNGFGEETAFRAYVQDRLIRRHGLWDGVALTSVSFVLLHLLISRICGLALLSSVLLAATYGILYVWTRSVYLVGTMHAVFNLAPRLLNQWPTDAGLLVVHALTLAAVIVLFSYRNQTRGDLHADRTGPGARDGRCPG